MIWQKHYQPPESSFWKGREDVSRFYQKIKCAKLDEALSAHSIALLGFCQDEGVKRNHGRVGAKEGPIHVRKALANLAWHRKDVVCFDVGDIKGGEDLETSQEALGQALSLLYKSQVLPIVIGGGHETAWGHFQGIAEQPFVEDIAIINFDAHFDLRKEKLSTSGTPFLQIADHCKDKNIGFNYYVFGIQEQANTDVLFETAQDLNVFYRTAQELYADESTLDRDIQNILSRHSHVYLSVCLDAFNLAHAPGVSAPCALGLNPWQVVPAIQALAKSGMVKSMDIVELAPKYDVDGATSKLTASLISQFIENVNWVIR